MSKADCPVLVVEDDPGLRDLMVWSLSDVGYKVAAAEHGGVGLELAMKERPCVIFLDMRMPVLDGWEFARSYRSLPGPHAPIIVVTAARDAAEWARQVEAADYLPKPFELHELFDKAERYFP